eukprot:TRINITY_DN3941_c0_g1_i7.p1 TRINITY_DN3941_c0_g1~~TRINITY_DN3941_c0_g1_i7.p1  ORF type:complete len:223 (+),score=14.53 TRINITY_DN3941_c0_g1_i7:79-669(+)
MLFAILLFLSGLSIHQCQQEFELYLPEVYDRLPESAQQDIIVQLEFIQELKQNLTEEYETQSNLWSLGMQKVEDYSYTIERLLAPAPPEKVFNVLVCDGIANATDQLGNVNTMEKVFNILKGDIDSLGMLGDELYVNYNSKYHYPEEYVRSTNDIEYRFTDDGAPYVMVTGPIERGYKITNFQELGVFSENCGSLK